MQVCRICDYEFEDTPEHIYRLKKCGHPVHRHPECFPRGLAFNITNKSFNRARCIPANQIQIGPIDCECNLPLDDEDIIELGSAELLAKVRQAEAERDNPRLQWCPAEGCDWKQEMDPNNGNRMVCGKCGTIFCGKHGAACQAKGKGNSFEEKCEHYDNSEDVVANEQLVREERDAGNIKQCPNISCGAAVTKHGGW